MGEIGPNLSFDELGEYSGDKVLAISIPFTVLTTIFLGLRFCSKRLMRSRSGLDDLLLVAAYFVNVGLCAIVIGKLGCEQCFFPICDSTADISTCSDDQNRRRRTSRSMGHKDQPLTDRPLGPTRADLRVFPLRGRRPAKISDSILLHPSIQLDGQDAGSLLHDDGSRGCSLAGKWYRRLSPMQTIGALVGQDNPGGNVLQRAAFLSGTGYHESYSGRSDTCITCEVHMGPQVAREQEDRAAARVWCGRLRNNSICCPRSNLLHYRCICRPNLSVPELCPRSQCSGDADVQAGATVDLCGWSIVEVGTYIITACLPEMRPLVPFLIPTRLLAQARKLMTISSATRSSATRNVHHCDDQNGFPSVVAHNSNIQGQFKDCGAWDGTSQDQRMEEPRSEQIDIEGSHKESYKEEVTERIDWENEGGLTFLITRTTLVTIDTLGSFERPWECLGPSIGRPTIVSGQSGRRE